MAIEAAMIPGASLVSGRQSAEEWRVTVKPSSMGNIPTISISEILRKSRMGSNALLKIEIEGTEKYLFEADRSWLEAGLIENLVLGLQAEDCRTAFFSKINPTRFVIQQCEEQLFA